jgi:Domain of unknown function (DUF5610)
MFASSLPFQSQSPFSSFSSAFSGLHGFGDSAGGRLEEGHSRSPGASQVRIQAESFQVFERIVSVEQSRAGFGPAATQPALGADNERPTAEMASGNILSFIEQRLRGDAANGADVDALAERLAQGLEGFKQGFEQARKELDDMDMLTPELEADIHETYDLVLAGVADMEGRLPDIAAGKYPVSPVDEPEVAIDHENSSPGAYGAFDIQEAYQRYDYRENNSFKLNLTTADGDSVTIKLSHRESFSSESLNGDYRGSGGRSQLAANSFEHSQDSRFKLEVDGHLDDGEMAAIEDLLAQVGDLSEQFFSGDLGQAFEQAQSLGYDSSEISSFSLNLRQTSVQRMQSAYQELMPSVDSISPMSQLLEPISSFIDDLAAAKEAAQQQFAGVNQLLADLGEVFERPQQTSFRDMMSQLLDGLQARA